jgi:hypothetical protein
MIGAPDFTPGERVVHFLTRATDGTPGVFQTFGLSQGKLVISPGPGGTPVVTTAARGLAYAGTEKAMWDDGPVTLEALLAAVRRHAAEARP